MAQIRFEVPYRFESDPRAVWDELVDWEAHGEWIPATRVEVEPGDPTAPGAGFTAWTGVGRLALEDRMRVVECTWDDAARRGECEVEKLGPVLVGSAGFVVSPDGSGTALTWIEDVEVRRVPQFLAPIAARLGAVGFRLGMRKLARLLAHRPTPTEI